ncbi:MAG TPA: phosphatase PAP2 family protein [Mycobacteriales bacterium]|nr:phosphatase PAP2 family protein [Mycobacteriales bacterium]
MTAVVERPAPAEVRRRRVISRRLPWWAEALLAVAGYEIYGLIQGDTDGARAEAVQHGWGIIHLEQHLHLWVEPRINAWLTPHHLLSLVSDYYYELSHAFVTAAVLVWLWRRHAELYARWRNTLLGLSLAALAVFWAYPVAPPRLTAPGLTDVLVKYDALGAAHAPSGLIDLYAALPSLHVAWALWCGMAVVAAGRTRRRWLALAYPALTTLVVLTTANHYVVDALAGAALTMGAVALAGLVRRRHATL